MNETCRTDGHLYGGFPVCARCDHVFNEESDEEGDDPEVLRAMSSFTLMLVEGGEQAVAWDIVVQTHGAELAWCVPRRYFNDGVWSVRLGVIGTQNTLWFHPGSEVPAWRPERHTEEHCPVCDGVDAADPGEEAHSNMGIYFNYQRCARMGHLDGDNDTACSRCGFTHGPFDQEE